MQSLATFPHLRSPKIIPSSTRNKSLPSKEQIFFRFVDTLEAYKDQLPRMTGDNIELSLSGVNASRSVCGTLQPRDYKFIRRWSLELIRTQSSMPESQRINTINRVGHRLWSKVSQIMIW
jgi:hypothetical protein